MLVITAGQVPLSSKSDDSTGRLVTLSGSPGAVHSSRTKQSWSSFTYQPASVDWGTRGRLDLFYDRRYHALNLWDLA